VQSRRDALWAEVHGKGVALQFRRVVRIIFGPDVVALYCCDELDVRLAFPFWTFCQISDGGVDLARVLLVAKSVKGFAVYANYWFVYVFNSQCCIVRGLCDWKLVKCASCRLVWVRLNLLRVDCLHLSCVLCIFLRLRTYSKLISRLLPLACLARRLQPIVARRVFRCQSVVFLSPEIFNFSELADARTSRNHLTAPISLLDIVTIVGH
jgi:hypothetical protein